MRRLVLQPLLFCGLLWCFHDGYLAWVPWIGIIQVLFHLGLQLLISRPILPTLSRRVPFHSPLPPVVLRRAAHQVPPQLVEGTLLALPLLDLRRFPLASCGLWLRLPSKTLVP